MGANTCGCTEVFKDYIVQCGETITIYTLNLTADTEYLVVLDSSIFGKVETLATTDASGYLVIEISDLPEGFVNQHAGTFSINVFDVSESPYTCRPVRLMLARSYDCVHMHVEYGQMIKDTIACPLPVEVIQE